MYLYQPCLLTMALYAWAFDRTKTKRRRLFVLLPLAILAVSEWELVYARVWLYPSALLLPLLFLWGRVRIVNWAEVLTASLLGGLVCWKTADTWPLFTGLTLVCAILLLIPVMFLCRDREDRLLACCLGSLFFELFFCLREYLLFSFCVIRLYSRDALSLGTAAICLYFLLEQAHDSVLVKLRHALSA